MKIALAVSVVLNLLLASFIVFIVSDKTAVENSLVGISENIDAERVATSDLLARLIVRKITKPELLQLLQNTYPQDRYFEKPEDNAVGFRSLYFIFDDKGLLTGVETQALSIPR